MISDHCPGNATLVRSSEEVVKGSEFTLTCLVPDLGRPRALLYKWSLGDHIVNHVTTETWTINPVTLETQVLLLFACIPSQKKLILPSSVHDHLYHCQWDDYYNGGDLDHKVGHGGDSGCRHPPHTRTHR